MSGKNLNLTVESKIDSVKKEYSFKKTEMASLKRKPDLCYDLEYILDRISAKTN